ncbi:hypothetical protein AVEN_58004-1 [Araneus ventricosus]|uniref:Uncharacterized protein n=1 Tax=Araneus ventricosus TaxID=182803 RepID=A0A4Y2TN02_ARAVE|nr:hypothetical protein AVEN_58004-1 [Araneus ventricosus]
MRHFGAIPDENSSLSDKYPFIGRSLCDRVSMKGLSMADDILLLGRHTDAPEYVEKQKYSLEILQLLNEFLNPIPFEERSEPSQEGHIKREVTADEEYCDHQQSTHMIQIQESSRNDNYLLDIKLE